MKIFRDHHPRLTWRWALLPAVCGVVLTAFLFHLARDRAAWEAGNRWLWTPQWPVFCDLAVTLEHLGEAEQGLDPLSDPTSDFAYPRAVLLLHHLQVQDVPSALLGAAQALVFMASVIFMLRPRGLRRALVTAGIFILPPVWFGLERGNIDLLLFVVCIVAAWLWAHANTLPRLVAPVVLMLGAAFLKLYPAFALVGAAAAERGRRQFLWIAAMFSVTGYWLIHAEELKLVMTKFPVGGTASWGCLIALKKIPGLFGPGSELGLIGLWWLSLAVYAVAFLGASGLGHRFAFKFRTTKTDRTEWAYYVLGTAICCGSFLASNYAYRWVFALLTLPLLMRLAGADRLLPAVWARTTLGTGVLSLAAPWEGLRVFFVAQTMNWAFILLLAFGFFAMRAQHLAPVPAMSGRIRLRVSPERVADDLVPAKTDRS